MCIEMKHINRSAAVQMPASRLVSRPYWDGTAAMQWPVRCRSVMTWIASLTAVHSLQLDIAIAIAAAAAAVAVIGTAAVAAECLRIVWIN